MLFRQQIWHNILSTEMIIGGMVAAYTDDRLYNDHFIIKAAVGSIVVRTL